MDVLEYLDTCLADYGVTGHRSAYTAQAVAHYEHVPGQNVAKPVVIKVDGDFYMCVLPADHLIDFKELRIRLSAHSVTLASEEEMMDLFPNCDVGTEPPFGILYGLETLMDTSLENDKFIVFQGGSHETAISMSMEEYKRLAYPKVMNFSVHIKRHPKSK